MDKDRTKVLLLWRKPEDWASVFIKWVSQLIPHERVIFVQAHNNGMRDSIFTLYELRAGENTAGEGASIFQTYLSPHSSLEFHGLDQRIILKALQIVEKQGKARIFAASTGDYGVKFLGSV